MELVDTDVLIDVQRGFKAAEEWFATDREIGVPGFVVMELVQDARNSDEVRKALALVESLDACSTRSTIGTTVCFPGSRSCVPTAGDVTVKKTASTCLASAQNSL
jgi:predicted nucleic acid-binding protein